MKRTEPGEQVARLEAAAALPEGRGERFDGYGVMGLPFRSGHVLAMRRFPVSPVGPGYTSVWHRTPEGEWIFYADVPPRNACTRFFGAQADEAIETPIALTWKSPRRLVMEIASAALLWEVEVRSTPATDLMSALGGRLPDAAWRNPGVLRAMELVAGPVLRVGRVGLHGRVPNGQQFTVKLRALWEIERSRATLAGADFGSPGPVAPQARLGDFWIPQRGMFALGVSSFEPFDLERHSSRTSRRDA